MKRVFPATALLALTCTDMSLAQDKNYYKTCSTFDPTGETMEVFDDLCELAGLDAEDILAEQAAVKSFSEAGVSMSDGILSDVELEELRLRGADAYGRAAVMRYTRDGGKSSEACQFARKAVSLYESMKGPVSDIKMKDVQARAKTVDLDCRNVKLVLPDRPTEAQKLEAEQSLQACYTQRPPAQYSAILSDCDRAQSRLDALAHAERKYVEALPLAKRTATVTDQLDRYYFSSGSVLFQKARIAQHSVPQDMNKVCKLSRQANDKYSLIKTKIGAGHPYYQAAQAVKQVVTMCNMKELGR